jgi:uncharacterized protein YdhG (YjbR/CyaY superfamily)
MTRTTKAKPDGAKPAGKGARGTAKGKGVAGRGKQASGTSNSALRNVDEYFAHLSEPARSRLKQMRAVIRLAVPAEAVEVISYQIPAFKTKKVLVWYAAFAEHCSLFPTASVIEDFKDELVGYRISKGTVQFPLDKALPTAVIKKLVKARVAQCEKAQRS